MQPNFFIVGAPKCATTNISYYLSLHPDVFISELTDAIQMPIGQFVQVHDRKAYPLGLNFKNDIVSSNEVWIGNAAQTLHPVAGQGLNLGLRDAATLANCLGPIFVNANNQRSTELIKGLEEFANLRKADRKATIGTTDFLARVFTSKFVPVIVGRGLALSALQWFPSIKSALARQMMFGQR